MLRHIAKNIVANGYAKKCEIQVAYAIGMKEPIYTRTTNYGHFGKENLPFLIIIYIMLKKQKT